MDRQARRIRMTECERIVKEKILPESFFEPEERNGFFVDANRKKTWAILIDLLVRFDRFCNDNHLNYFLIFGSLLGAVRHKGFIPWDDDVDIVMPRDDYNKFTSLAGKIDRPYCIQSYLNESDFFLSFAKFRNVNTTCISKPFSHRKFNQGIALDIFPLDNFENQSAQERFDRIKWLNMQNSTYMRMGNPYLDASSQERIKQHSGRAPLDVLQEIESLVTQFNNKETDKVGVNALTIYSFEKNTWLKRDFDSFDLMEFECCRFRVPCGFEDVLTTTYGDYMQFPPVEKRGGWHNNLIIDPDTPFSEYKI